MAMRSFLSVVVIVVCEILLASNATLALAQGAGGVQAPVPLGVGLINQIYCQPRCNQTLGIQGRNNCGAASLAMVATANGKQRPDQATTNQAYVRHIKSLLKGSDNCNLVVPEEIDKGAGSLGLALGGTAKNAKEMIPITQACVPVIAYVKASGFPWDNPHDLDYGSACHIVVITGFRLDQAGSPLKVLIQDPLNAQTLPACNANTEPLDDNSVIGFDNREFLFSDFDAGVAACNPGIWKGRGIGRILPGCDGAGGNPGGAPPQPGVLIDQVTVRVSTTCPGQPLEIFYMTDCTPVTWKDKFKKTKTLTADGKFHNYTLTFSNREQWSGNINRLRIDLTPRDTDCQVAVSWIGIHSKDGQIAKSWQFLSGSGSGGWWANHLLTSGFIGPFWLMKPFLPQGITLSTQDPFIEHDNIGVPTGR